MPIVNQFSKTIHSHIDTNRYQRGSFCFLRRGLFSEQGISFLVRQMYSLLEHVGNSAPRGNSMNRNNDFEKPLKIFCRHSSDSIQTTKTFADHICKLTAIHIQNTCQFEWILNCDKYMIDLANTSFHLPH